MSTEKVGMDPLPPSPVKKHKFGDEEGSMTSRASLTRSSRTHYTDEQNAMMTITASRNATWHGTAYHNVTAMVGAGVLGLPYAMTFLGWPGGVITLLFSWAVSLFTFQFLVRMHEAPDGTRRDRYHELARDVLGDRWGTWLLLPFQITLFVGIPITYTVTGAQSLQKVVALLNPGAHNPGVSVWIVVFSAVQLIVIQIRSFHSLTYVSLFGAFASIFYSMVAFITTVSEGKQENVSYSVQGDRSKPNLLFGIFNSIATMMFAYGGHNIALEIQATLPRPPSTYKRMMRGVWAAFILTPICYYTVAISGYWAYGRSVEPNILLSLGRPKGLIAAANLFVFLHVVAGYQVYTFPLIDMYDQVAVKRGINPGNVLWRLAVRSAMVVFTAVIACLIPFFGDLMGFLGAIAVTPTTYIMPCILWLIAMKPRWTHWTFWFCYLSLPITFSIMILGSIGSIRNIITSASTYGTFQ
eukprot:jgi/Botrbrau1/15791/Bobra.4_1s0142.1